MAFVHLRPRYFAEIMANLLFWLGPDKLCFGSDYAIWSPKWLIEKFMAFELPEDLKQEYHVDLTFEIKRKILGENTAPLVRDRHPGTDGQAHPGRARHPQLIRHCLPR